MSVIITKHAKRRAKQRGIKGFLKPQYIAQAHFVRSVGNYEERRNGSVTYVVAPYPRKLVVITVY